MNEDFYGEDNDTLNPINNKSPNELSIIWKEALAQIDYGFDLSTSTVFIFGDIGDGSLYDMILRIRAILHMRSEDKKDDPINLVINSDGGDMYEALGMIDYIQSLNVKVNTICRGRVMSAAALLLCAGTGIRAASKHSTIMFHEISSGIYGKSSDMKASMAHMEKLEDILIDLIYHNSNKDRKFWRNKTLKDYYLNSEEALEHGVIDKIIDSVHVRTQKDEI